MTRQRRAPKAVDAYEHYYGVSVAFTKTGKVRLSLTQFNLSPRQLVSTEIAFLEGHHYSTNVAAQWLILAAEEAAKILVPESSDEDPGSQLSIW